MSLPYLAKGEIGRSLGPVVSGWLPFVCDYRDPATVMQGAKIRFLRQQPKPNRKLLREFGRFVDRFLKKHLRKVENVDFDEWLERSHYSAKVRNQLRQVYSKLVGFPKSHYKGFGKAEFMNAGTEQYEEYVKSIRCINGVSDAFKVFAGPYMYAIEKILYELPWFAKHIPVCDRPRVVMERLGKFGGPFVVTDYTSFESSFSSEFMKVSECKLFLYMLDRFPLVASFLAKQAHSKHKMYYRGFDVSVMGIRMSGDCHTSLANGFSNLMLTLFCAEKSGVFCDGLVEGDDGLFYFGGDVDFEIVKQLGFDLKKEVHSTIYDTKFCGLCFSRSLASFVDPRFNILKIAWSLSPLRNRSVSVRLGLLRAKALSLLYLAPRCPILSVYCVRLLALTKGKRAIFDNSFWDRELVAQVLSRNIDTMTEYHRGITYDDRVDFDNMYDVPIDLQLHLEDYLSRIADLSEMRHWSLSCLFVNYHRWAENFRTQVVCGSARPGLWGS